MAKSEWVTGDSLRWELDGEPQEKDVAEGEDRPDHWGYCAHPRFLGTAGNKRHLSEVSSVLEHHPDQDDRDTNLLVDAL